jgi:hypothetical protein
VIAPLELDAPGLTSAWTVSVPPASVKTPEHAIVDVRKLADPFVVKQPAWSLPTTLPVARTSGAVRTERLELRVCMIGP